MKIDDKIRDEKLQYDINREAAKISSGKVNKNKCLTGEEILPRDQGRLIEQAKFAYFQLAKAFEKNKKNKKNDLQLKMRFQKIYYVKKIKLNLIKLKKQKKRQIEKIYIIK